MAHLGRAVLLAYPSILIDQAAAAIQKESLTLVYNTTHAVQLIHSALH